MLRAVLCCVLIAATAAMAWEQLENVPAQAEVDYGTHITWGKGLVWGMFPTYDAQFPETYVGFYDPGEDEWELLEEAMEDEELEHTSLTFQWLEDGVLFGIGDYDDDAYLYFYSLYNGEWDSYDIDDEEEFEIGNGACIAYQPNVNYTRQMNPVPGWIYCLPGGGSQEFWRYAIPTSLPNLALDGIYPGSGAVIADQTPLFQWGSTASPQYRLLVSTNSLFSDTVLDKVISNPEYQDSSVLVNGTYYWRTATWVSSAWSWGLTHNFELDGGWQQLQDIPGSVGTGAAMAYDGDAFGHQSIIALRGGGQEDYYEYDIVADDWDPEEDAPENVYAGTSLTTHDPTEESGLFQWAAFGGSETTDYPWYYNPYGSPHQWVLFDELDAAFPEHLGSEASMCSGQGHYLYLVVGDNHFYRLDPPAVEGGQGSRVPRSEKAQAHVVACRGGIEVEYQLPVSARIRATLHDAVGRQVGGLDAGDQQPGIHRLSWDRDSEGRKLSSGAYFVLLDVGAEQAKLKAIVR